VVWAEFDAFRSRYTGRAASFDPFGSTVHLLAITSHVLTTLPLCSSQHKVGGVGESSRMCQLTDPRRSPCRTDQKTWLG
jgi:hypothetical protein